MKNTVKKILALVFAVAMICTLAVPAFAKERNSYAFVTVVNYNGVAEASDVEIAPSKLNVEDAIKAFNKLSTTNTNDVDISTSTGLVTKVADKKASDVDKVFATGYWAVAVNGKEVKDDLGTVAIEEGAQIVVYWNDPTYGTKLVQMDDSNIEKGVVSFFYYNGEEKVALADATVVLMDGADKVVNAIAALDCPAKDLADTHGDTTCKDDCTCPAHVHDDDCGALEFVTDEKGQIWLDPATVAADNDIEVASVKIDLLKEISDKNDNYTDEERTEYNKESNRKRNIEDAAVVDGFWNDISTGSYLYDVADATGDNTMVYALVAFAAVATLAVVVVLKKKSVKAN